jgi:hypothetical protein
LRDDHIDCSFSSLNGLSDRSDLQHHPCADSVGLPHLIAGIAEREGDDPRAAPPVYNERPPHPGIEVCIAWPRGEFRHRRAETS